MPVIKTVGIISKPNAPAAGDLVPKLIEWLRHRPVMRQIHRLPGGIIKSRRSRAPRTARFGVVIGHLMAENRGKWNVALVEQPSAIQRKPLASDRGAGILCPQ